MSLRRLESALNEKFDSWSDFSSFDNTPYPIGMRSSLAQISALRFSPFNPNYWAVDSPSSASAIEPDSDNEEPPPIRTRRQQAEDCVCSRGLTNCGCLIISLFALLLLFIGYPVISTLVRKPVSTLGAFNIGGLNASGQVPLLIGNHGLVDADTPHSAYTMASWQNPSQEMTLVFSDEFNADGRSFYPGDDPYWEALDLHYWETNNLEWYDPSAVTTVNGSLVITLSEMQTHDLNFQGGMMTSWNKFCFTGGYIEVSVVLPGANNIMGLWPAIWTMGNLGRAGYGATLEGLWPYTYDACDVGTVLNQTLDGQPAAATINGEGTFGGVLSYLPGQRLSRCTCEGETHPGPKHLDGTFVGRSAPEIDIFEAQISKNTFISEVSQSAQWAPFDAGYMWQNTTQNLIIANPEITAQNVFTGSVTQQATSVVTNTMPTAYEDNGGEFAIYGFEYKPGFDNAYITWISSGNISWTLKSSGMGANSEVEISARPVSQEPMYLIMNLGMSENFGFVDLVHLPFPVHMQVDYVRVYQPSNAINVGCNPTSFPTQAYINTYLEAYTNPNLTTWVDDYQQSWPKNSFLGQC